MRLLITGTAGFIGSTLVRYLLDTVGDIEIISLDSLEYSGHEVNLESIPGGIDSDRHRLVQGSICDKSLVDNILSKGVDGIINVAAHTHVDRAYYHPELFIHNNVAGVLNLLRAASRFDTGRFLQVSTDEVYGSTEVDKPFDETAPLQPGNYYSSSKAAADLYISAAVNTDKIDAVIVRGTNNFGPRQFPEKAIPFFTRRVLNDESVPLYGHGQQMRDWLYVEDFCRAIWLVFEKGRPGEIYNAGAGNHMTNLDLAKKLIKIMGADLRLIKHVADRPGHDFCYAVDWSKIKKLGWRPEADFEARLEETVKWYGDNKKWVSTILNKVSARDVNDDFFEEHYRDRR